MQSQTIFKMKFEDFLIMISPNLLDLGYLKKNFTLDHPLLKFREICKEPGL